MFKNETLAAYGCIKNTVRSTKKATLFYVLIITAFHALLLYFPELLILLLPSHPKSPEALSTWGLILAGIGLFLLFVIFITVCSGYRNYALEISRGSHACFSDILAPFCAPLRCISVSLMIALFLLLSAVLSVLAATVSVLLFALVVFAACFTLCVYRPLWFVVYDRPELSVFECFRQTRQITKGRRKDLFAFDLYFLWFPFLASVLPYFIFSIPVLFPSVLSGMPYGVQEIVVFVLGEVFSAIVYIWKFDYVSTAYACLYNEIC